MAWCMDSVEGPVTSPNGVSILRIEIGYKGLIDTLTSSQFLCTVCNAHCLLPRLRHVHSNDWCRNLIRQSASQSAMVDVGMSDNNTGNSGAWRNDVQNTSQMPWIIRSRINDSDVTSANEEGICPRAGHSSTIRRNHPPQAFGKISLNPCALHLKPCLPTSARVTLLIMALPDFKHYIPRSLFSRAALIVLLPLILLQLLVSFVFVQRHFEGVTRQMSRSIAREIAVAQQVIDTSPTAAIAQLRLINLSRPLAMPLDLEAETEQPGQSRRHWYDLSGRALTEELRALLGREVAVDLVDDSHMVVVRLKTEKGILNAVIPRVRVTASNPHQLLVVMVLASLILIGIAFLFLRNQIRPILELANVSEAFGKGRSLPYRPSGAEEIRRAGSTFLSMRSRLERQMEQRTQMLTGVSHDLRTPLTRMKLSLELMDPSPEVAPMMRDVADMEAMLDAFLAFAKGDQMEDPVAADPAQIVRDIVTQTERSGASISFSLPSEQDGHAEVMLRYQSVSRALQNLINNAAHYGGVVKVSLKLLPKTCEFIVEDDGPGIPEERREDVKKPFLRLDTSRNLNKGGGVGLGLSIAQDVAHIHGGNLELGESADMGGLKATLRLPR